MLLNFVFMFIMLRAMSRFRFGEKKYKDLGLVKKKMKNEKNG